MSKITMTGILATFTAAACALAGEPAADVSFSKQVAPILKASCMKCHDAKTHKGGIDFTSYETTLKGGEDGPVIKAGDPDASPLVKSISGDKPDMPKKAPPLKKEQVALLAQWIKEGAKNN